MKVIFLDIDGVLNSERLMNRRILEGFKCDCDEELYHNIDEIEVERLANFCKEYNVKIVLSSSWRCWNLEETIEDLSHLRYKHIHPIIKYIVGVTPRLYIEKPNGGWNHLDRGHEIQKYIDGHKDIEEYIIIDDDGDMLDEQLFHFVQTNYEDGITELETNWAIKILNRKFFQNPMALNFTLRNEWINKCKGLPNRQEELWKYNDLEKDLDNRYGED